ncbi:right-handed parallel beta-helix repeat-containing protein [Paenibacillus motobuensis]|uniref:Pectate lyase superfamily protein domain-containing protein n=1 Tax=Paenibacillus motobuensis TaxID=295324 RepID=A0ABN0YRF2_9BACL
MAFKIYRGSSLLRRNLFKSRFLIYLLLFSLSAIVVLAITSPYRNMTINIMQAGARGDGIRDDSAVFIRALHQAAGRKGSTRIIVPAGTYLLNVKEPLELSSNTRLIGEDKPVLKFIAQPSEAFGYEAIRISGRDVLVDGIELDGSGSFIRGIGIHPGSADVTIANSVIRNMRQAADPQSPLYSAVVSGIMIYGDTEDIKVITSLITDISAMHSQPVARGIMVWNGSGASPAKRVTISGNEISYITPREDADGIFFDVPPNLAELSDSIVENNKIHHAAKRGIKISAPGVIVRNNYITNSYSGNNRYLFDPEQPLSQDMYSAISIYASHVTVSENLINGRGSYYAAIEADFENLDRIVIENNRIDGEQTEQAEEMTTGIRLGAFDSSNVRGNVIRNVGTAIYIAGRDTDHDNNVLGSLLSENDVAGIKNRTAPANPK